MKKKPFLIATSVIAMTLAVPAIAETTQPNTNNPDYTQTETTTKQEIREGWKETKDAVSDAADSVSDATAEAYKDTKSFIKKNVAGDDALQQENQSYVLAETVIGQNIENANGDVIAEVKDIAINNDGNVEGLVVEYGGFLGMAQKNVMLGLDAVAAKSDNSGYTTSLSQASLDQYPRFDREKLSGSMYLASAMLDGHIVDPKNDDLASVDNIVIENSEATKLVVSYYDGVVPEQATINFTDADIVVDKDDNVTFRVSQLGKQQFEAFVNSSKQ